MSHSPDLPDLDQPDDYKGRIETEPTPVHTNKTENSETSQSQDQSNLAPASHDTTEESSHDQEAEPDADLELEAEPGSEPEAEAEAEQETEPEAEPQAELQAKPDPEAEPVSEPPGSSKIPDSQPSDAYERKYGDEKDKGKDKGKGKGKGKDKHPWTINRVPTTIASDADYGLDSFGWDDEMAPDSSALDIEREKFRLEELAAEREILKSLSVKADAMEVSPDDLVNEDQADQVGKTSSPQSLPLDMPKIMTGSSSDFTDTSASDRLRRKSHPRVIGLSPTYSESDEGGDDTPNYSKSKRKRHNKPKSIKHLKLVLGKYRVFHEVQTSKSKSVRFAFSDEGNVCIKEYCDYEYYENALDVLKLFQGIPETESPVARLIDYHEDHDNDEYITITEMGYTTLRDELDKGKLSLTFGVVAAQLTKRLARLHDEDIVHGNLKPDNICLFESGWKFIDLDYSQRTGVKLFDTGSYLYASPEVVANALGQAFDEDTIANPAQDMWSFGAVLLECLTGRHMFEGSERAKLRLIKVYKKKQFEYCEQGEKDWPYRVARNLLRPDVLKRFTSKDMTVKKAFTATPQNINKVAMSVLNVKKQIRKKQCYVEMPYEKYPRVIYRLSGLFYQTCLKALRSVPIKRDVPALYVLLPRDKSKMIYKRKMKKTLKEIFHVHILCEGHGDGSDCHLTSHGGFEVDVRKGGIRDSLPTFRIGLRILSEAVYKAPEATRELTTYFQDGIELHKHLGLKGHVDYESISDNLEWMGCCLDDFNQLFSAIDINIQSRLEANEGKPDVIKQMITKGATSLSGLLKNEDEPQGTLRRISVTEKGKERYLWVCSKHRKAIIKKYQASMQIATRSRRRRSSKAFDRIEPPPVETDSKNAPAEMPDLEHFDKHSSSSHDPKRRSKESSGRRKSRDSSGRRKSRDSTGRRKSRDISRRISRDLDEPDVDQSGKHRRRRSRKSNPSSGELDASDIKGISRVKSPHSKKKTKALRQTSAGVKATSTGEVASEEKAYSEDLEAFRAKYKVEKMVHRSLAQTISKFKRKADREFRACQDLREELSDEYGIKPDDIQVQNPQSPKSPRNPPDDPITKPKKTGKLNFLRNIKKKSTKEK